MANQHGLESEVFKMTDSVKFPRRLYVCDYDITSGDAITISDLADSTQLAFAGDVQNIVVEYVRMRRGKIGENDKIVWNKEKK